MDGTCIQPFWSLEIILYDGNEPPEQLDRAGFIPCGLDEDWNLQPGQYRLRFESDNNAFGPKTTCSYTATITVQ